LPNLTLNILFDGVFHAATWVTTGIGLFLLHRAHVDMTEGMRRVA
jgi:uncharacterized membrane protein